ncbi:MAG: autotransporter domain-containing protein, partial [Sphingomicrobium sp.]
ASGIAVTGASSITNSGTLTGGNNASFGYGAQFSAGSSGSLVNQSGGTIGGGTGSVLVATDNAVSVDLQAGSTANGAILSTGAGARNVTIAGALNGSYIASGGTGIDTVTLASTGSFTGGALGADNDSFTTLGGAMSSTLDGGAGTDSVTFNNSNNVSYVGFTNFETGTKLGSGRVTLSGSSSIGALAINAGRLDVNGSLASAVAVNNGGTLGGSGQVAGSLTINSGGILSPGGIVPVIVSTGIHTQLAPPPSYSTFTVNGPLTFNAGSFYDVDIDPTQSDHTIVNGSTTLNGGTVRVNAANGTYNPLTIYTIIQSSVGVTGQFAGVTDNLAFLDTSLTYTANQVNLEARRNNIVFSAVAANPNQANVANAVQSIGSGALYDAVLVQTAAGAQQAYDALSGEVYASTQTAIFGNRDRLQDAMASNRLRTDGMGLWIDAGRSWGTYDQSISRGYAIASSDTNDLLGGFNWTRGSLGLTAAGGRVIDKLEINERDSKAKTKTKSWLFGGQVAYGAELGLHAVAGANYASHKVSTDRSIIFPGFAERASSSRKGNGYHLFAQVGVASQMSGITLEPFIGLSRDHLKLDAVSEDGGLAALDVRSASRRLTSAQVGLKLSAVANLGWATLTPRTSIAWQHVMGDRNGQMDAGFQAGGLDYSITGAALARDAAKVGLDLALDFGGATVIAGYNGSIGGDASQHTAKLAFQLHF